MPLPFPFGLANPFKSRISCKNGVSSRLWLSIWLPIFVFAVQLRKSEGLVLHHPIISHLSASDMCPGVFPDPESQLFVLSVKHWNFSMEALELADCPATSIQLH